MQQVIYGDILFIINFSMDFLALYISGSLLHRQKSTAALTIAAAIGALYSVVCLFGEGNRIIQLIIDAAAALLICYIAYGGRAGAVLRLTLLFYFVNFAMGGGMTAVYSAVNAARSKSIYINGSIEEVYSGISPKWFILAALVSGAVSVVSSLISRRKASTAADLTIEFEGRQAKISGFFDSGNFLCEPIGMRPVVIVKAENVKDILPQKLFDVLALHDADGLEELGFEYANRIRAIPVSSVGHSGIMLGFLPDSVTVCGEYKSVCIAIDPSKNGDFGGYDAIVPQVLCESK